jgi:hypothetical protein
VNAVPESVVLALDEAYIEFLDRALDLPSFDPEAAPKKICCSCALFRRSMASQACDWANGIAHPELVSELENDSAAFTSTP